MKLHVPDFKRKSLHFLLLAVILCVVCVLPQLQSLYKNNTRTITVESENPQNLSLRAETVKQTLYLQGELRQLQLYLSAPSGELYQDASITFRLEQGDAFDQITVSAKEIGSGMYEPDLNLNLFSPGEATLSMWGSDFPKGTDVYAVVSATVTSGLPAAQLAGGACQGPLIVQYRLFQINSFFWHDTVLLILLCVAVLFSARLIVYHRQWMRKYNLLYLCSFVLIFLYSALQNPTAGFLAEPSSEVAYEFWYKAHEYGFFKSLMTLMSGESLVWLERILMWLADTVSPVRYVFLTAQLMQLVFIAAVTSMPCLKSFGKYFSEEERLLFSFFTGALMLFPSAYYFWGVSYWASFFLIYFGMMDMQEMKRWQYVAGLLLTVILCVSRIYHIVYIPIALFLLVVLYKERGIRFRIYCIVIALASSFEVLYSLLQSEQQHVSTGVSIDLLRIVGNTVYYQLQVINSLFCGTAHANGLVSNVLSAGFFAGIIALFIFSLCTSGRKKGFSALLGSMGALSLGTIAINVVVCMVSSTVGFPYDYSAPVDWTKNYYQQADFHFSYSYIALAVLIAAAVYFLKLRFTAYVKAAAADQPRQKQMIYDVQTVRKACVMMGIMLLTAMVAHQKYDIRIVPVEWKAIYSITQNDSYYAAINVSYGVADISLEHNSRGMIIGQSATGEWFLWNEDKSKPYNTEQIYQQATIGSIGNLKEQEILSVTVRKAMTNFDTYYVAVFLDKNGNVLDKVRQANSPNRFWIDFIPDQPLQGVDSIAFEYEDGSPAYVCDALQIGVVDMRS